MFRSLKKLFNSSSKTTKTRNRVRLQVEGLEGRLLMSASPLIADFNGDNHGDMAIVTGEGEIRVQYGSNDGLQAFGQQVLRSSNRGDKFGHAMAAGDLNGDGFADLAVGAPGTFSDSGIVYVYYGSEGGLAGQKHRETWSQNTPGIKGLSRVRDQFGWSLAIGNFNGDINQQTRKPIQDLAIGVPGDDVEIDFSQIPNSWYKGTITYRDAGAVNVIYGTAAGLSSTNDQYWHQGTPRRFGEYRNALEDQLMERGDQFGYSLAAGNFDGDAEDDLAIGVPGEEYEQDGLVIGLNTWLFPEIGFGGVHVLYGSPSLPPSISQYLPPGFDFPSGLAAIDSVFIRRDDLHGTGLSLAAGNFDQGDADDLVIGHSGDDNRGVVEVFYGNENRRFESRGNSIWDQNKLSGEGKKNDEFGKIMSVADIDNDGYSDLAIANPRLNSFKGGVHVIHGSVEGLLIERSQFWTQDSSGVKGVAQNGDFFGQQIALGDINGDGKADLVVKVSDGTRNAALNVLFSRYDGEGLSATGNQMYFLGSYGYYKDDQRFLPPPMDFAQQWVSQNVNRPFKSKPVKSHWFGQIDWTANSQRVVSTYGSNASAAPYRTTTTASFSSKAVTSSPVTKVVTVGLWWR